MTDNKQETCAERFEGSRDSRIEDIRLLWAAECAGNEEGVEDLGTFNEYGLCFDYVAPGTFTDQNEGYWRYQISCGGLSEEFRFYASRPGDKCYRIEFAFLDWYDGETRTLHGADQELMHEIWDFFREVGSAEHTYAEATQDS